ncbi:MAG: SUMF1/EgtB/PvdO family nonheme iron enzyme [Wenzhouxiangella sp.]
MLSFLRTTAAGLARLAVLPIVLSMASLAVAEALAPVVEVEASILAPAAGVEAPELEAALREEIEVLLLQADNALARGWLTAPRGRSAADFFAEVLAIDPDQADALAGMTTLQRDLVEEALELARAMDYETANERLDQARALHEDALLLAWASSQLYRIRREQIDEAEQAVFLLMEQGDYDQAEERLTDLVALGLRRPRIEEIRSELATRRVYGPFSPGQVFSDPLVGLDATGPRMVVIPAGVFLKGSPDNESGRQRHEGPRYRVTFDRGFALAQTETTVEEFARFVADTEYVTDAERRGWTNVYEPRSGRMSRRSRINWRHDYLGRDAEADLPVIHVSWRDAAAFSAWLAERTGQAYRLPSESEFEYALRAGSQTRFWWGDEGPTEPLENLTGDGDLSPTNSRWSVAFPRYSDGFWGPAPVGSLRPNPFGLYDMGGNVMEWTEDCWHDSFVRAPVDGSAWVNPGCTLRVIRGGAWSSTPDMSRSAFRVSGADDSADMRVGFRVARDL